MEKTAATNQAELEDLNRAIEEAKEQAEGTNLKREYLIEGMPSRYGVNPALLDPLSDSASSYLDDDVGFVSYAREAFKDQLKEPDEEAEKLHKRIGGLEQAIKQSNLEIDKNRADVLATFRLLFDLKGGIYTLIKNDPELAVLFYQLDEAYVVDRIYSIASKYVELAALFKDPKEQWESVTRDFDHMRNVLLEGVKKNRIRADTLKSCCTLSEDQDILDRFLNSELLSPTSQSDEAETIADT